MIQEGVSETLEELWISYNFIEKIKGVTVLKKLKVLYMSNNLVKEWGEFNKLQELPALEDLLFVGKYTFAYLIHYKSAYSSIPIGNPLYDNLEEAAWRTEATKRLPNLKKLDGETVLRDEGD